MESDDKFTIVNKKQDTLELYEDDSGESQTTNGYFKNDNSKVYIKQYIGLNTNNKSGTQNFTLSKRTDTKNFKLHFMLYKIHTRHYININNSHVIEIDKFLFIKRMEEYDGAVCMDNSLLGEIIIEKCDLDLINKCISIVEKYQSEHKRGFFDYLEYLFA